MRILITGAFGFVGRHLIREFLQAGHEVAALDLNIPPNEFAHIETHKGDIRDSALVDRAVAESMPDACVHLSALTFVPDGWLEIKNVFSINLFGTLNILEAFRKTAPGARILIVSSAEVYGHKPGKRPVAESAPTAPDNPYAISKTAADLTALSYASQHGMHTMTVRPGNHIGPGQSPDFVAPALARQVAAIARGNAPPVIKTGNLESKRDFTDVRDVARAYRLLIEKGRAGQAYNIGSGEPVTIRRILDELCAIAKIHPKNETDPARFRPTEERPVLDITKIGEDTGWKPEIPLSQTLRDITADLYAPEKD